MGLKSSLRSAIREHWFDKRNFRYHFIHIPKNGGVSVRHALELQSDVSLSNPYHFRYIDIAEEVGRQLRFFSVVRNPWSRTASRYHFGRQSAGNWPESDPRRQYLATATFADYVKDQRVLPIPEHLNQPWMGPLSSWFNQLEWLRDESGRVVTDCLRLESLTSDLSEYLGRSISLADKNAAHARYDYRSMYNDELTEIVAETFRDDIEHFGFSFDGSATRNIATLVA